MWEDTQASIRSSHTSRGSRMSSVYHCYACFLHWYLCLDHNKSLSDGRDDVSNRKIHEDRSFHCPRRNNDWFFPFFMYYLFFPTHLLYLSWCYKRKEKDEGLDDSDGSSGFCFLVSQWRGSESESLGRKHHWQRGCTSAGRVLALHV